MLTTVRVGIRRRLERRGLIRSDTGGDEADPDAEEAPWRAAGSAASVQGTVAMGPKAGHYVGRLGGELAALPDSMSPPASCVRAEGYSLHAGVRVAAGDRQRLERRCRYVARPAVARERLKELADGRFAYRVRHAWSDGTEVLVFEPLTLIEKLVALVAWPHAHLVRYHGVLAPRSSWRAEIVPRPEVSDEVAQTGGGEGSGQRAGKRASWAMLLSRVFSVDILECLGVWGAPSGDRGGEGPERGEGHPGGARASGGAAGAITGAAATPAFLRFSGRHVVFSSLGCWGPLAGVCPTG